MLIFLIGIYIGLMYAMSILSYFDFEFETHEPLDVYDVIFIVFSPVTVPLILISSLINHNPQK